MCQPKCGKEKRGGEAGRPEGERAKQKLGILSGNILTNIAHFIIINVCLSALYRRTAIDTTEE